VQRDLYPNKHGDSGSTIMRLQHKYNTKLIYTLSEAWSGVNWADLMAAQGAFGTDFYDRSTRKMVGTMLWTEYNRPVIKRRPGQP